MNEPVHIDELYAFVADEGLGEGVVAMYTDNGWLPLVGADVARVDQLRGIAQKIATETGQPLKLLRFTTRTQVEVIEP